MSMKSCITVENNILTIKNIYKLTRKNCIIGEILGSFLSNEDPIFMELYREDGINIKKGKKQFYKDQIDAFFQSSGIVNHFNQYLLYAKTNVSRRLLSILPLIFDYFQEVTFFVPSISWNDFEKEQSNYLSKRTNDYLPFAKNGLVFQYLDSSDLLICCSNGKKTMEIQDTVSSIVE